MARFIEDLYPRRNRISENCYRFWEIAGRIDQKVFLTQDEIELLTQTLPPTGNRFGHGRDITKAVKSADGRTYITFASLPHESNMHIFWYEVETYNA